MALPEHRASIKQTVLNSALLNGPINSGKSASGSKLCLLGDFPLPAIAHLRRELAVYAYQGPRPSVLKAKLLSVFTIKRWKVLLKKQLTSLGNDVIMSQTIIWAPAKTSMNDL